MSRPENRPAPARWLYDLAAVHHPSRSRLARMSRHRGHLERVTAWVRRLSGNPVDVGMKRASRTITPRPFPAALHQCRLTDPLSCDGRTIAASCCNYLLVPAAGRRSGFGAPGRLSVRAVHR